MARSCAGVGPLEEAGEVGEPPFPEEPPPPLPLEEPEVVDPEPVEPEPEPVEADPLDPDPDASADRAEVIESSKLANWPTLTVLPAESVDVPVATVPVEELLERPRRITTRAMIDAAAPPIINHVLASGERATSHPRGRLRRRRRHVARPGARAP